MSPSLEKSGAFPLGGKLLSAGNLQAPLAKDLLLSRQKVREARGCGGIRRKEPCNHAFALGDLDFLAVAEKAFQGGENR